MLFENLIPYQNRVIRPVRDLEGKFLLDSQGVRNRYR